MGQLIAKDTGGSIAPIEEGVYQAACYLVCDLGTHHSDLWEKDQHKVLIGWELPDVRITVEEDGEKVDRPRVISKQYTLSLGDRANLRHDLEAWRGRKFTSEELKAFNLENLLGANCQIQVVHTEKNGKTYTNIGALMALPKGMPKKAGELPALCYSLADAKPGSSMPPVPAWVQGIIAQSKEWIALSGETELVTSTESDAPISTIKDEDIPF